MGILDSSSVTLLSRVLVVETTGEQIVERDQHIALIGTVGRDF